MFKVRPVVSLVAVALSLAAIGCSGADAEDDFESSGLTSEALSGPSLPPLPSPDLAVPEGNKLAFFLDAMGVQIYACQATDTGFAWTFQAPQADLVDRRGRVVGDHYAGPTWESLRDGSTVVAARIAGYTDDPSAIPELLLEANAHTGHGMMSNVTYIQRLETTGGLMPASGCDAGHVGDIARVDYAATYYFYRDKRCR